MTRGAGCERASLMHHRARPTAVIPGLVPGTHGATGTEWYANTPRPQKNENNAIRQRHPLPDEPLVFVHFTEADIGKLAGQRSLIASDLRGITDRLVEMQKPVNDPLRTLKLELPPPMKTIHDCCSQRAIRRAEKWCSRQRGGRFPYAIRQLAKIRSPWHVPRLGIGTEAIQIE